MDLRDLARANQKQILQLILRKGGISRTDIAKQSGLAKSSITEITERLLAAGVLSELAIKRTGRRGRPVVMLALDPRNSLVIVVECTDEVARARLVEPSGQVLRTFSRELGPRADFEEYVSLLRKGVHAVGRGRWEAVKAIVVIMAGVVDPQKGLLLSTSHSDWTNKQMLKPFQDFRAQPFLQNVAHLCAVAENWYGVAQDVEDFLYFHLDAGIGGAIVIDGVLAEGPSHGAGEFGHMVVADDDGPECRCGARGCVESIASMRAIPRAIGRKCADFAEAWHRFQEGDAIAREVFERAIRLLGRCILNAAVAIGPTTAVLGGRMVDETNGAIVALIREEMAGVSSFVGDLEVRRCALDEEHARIQGAVAYALQEMDFGS